MKKKFGLAAVLATVLAATLLFVSCGIADPKFEDMSSAESEKFIKENMPAEYSITYTYGGYTSDGKETASGQYIHKYIRTAEGYYSQWQETADGPFYAAMYKKNAATGKYDWYSGDQNGLVKQPNDFSEDNLDDDYMADFGHWYGNIGSLKKKGSQKIAGRTCIRFEESVNLIIIKYKNTVLIDKETGICMKYFIGGSGLGSSVGINFECTDFTTKNVALPAV